jgi:DNA replication protein
VLRELWLRWHKVGRFVVAPELIRRFQATFSEEASESKEDVHRELTLAPLLVLDDYGTEKATDFANAEMFRLVNDRHSNGRPTIVTTNLDVMSLDPRIKSRLTDRERSVWLQFTGADRRDLGR